MSNNSTNDVDLLIYICRPPVQTESDTSVATKRKKKLPTGAISAIEVNEVKRQDCCGSQKVALFASNHSRLHNSFALRLLSDSIKVN